MMAHFASRFDWTDQFPLKWETQIYDTKGQKVIQKA